MFLVNRLKIGLHSFGMRYFNWVSAFAGMTRVG